MFRKTVRSIVDPLGLGKFTRQAFVEFNLIGERILFCIKERPHPSESIFVAGSSRSGTTWLDELLFTVSGIQEIFEPLHPVRNHRVRELTGWGTTGRFYCGVNNYYLRPEENYPEWYAHWNDIFSGTFRNFGTDAKRVSYFPSKYLIKEIRANLMLGYLYDHFQPKIIYLVRHPCAVTYSRLMNNFGADVNDILSQEELVEDYLRPWIGKIEREKDRLGALAVWWQLKTWLPIGNYLRARIFLSHMRRWLLSRVRH